MTAEAAREIERRRMDERTKVWRLATAVIDVSKANGWNGAHLAKVLAMMALRATRIGELTNQEER